MEEEKKLENIEAQDESPPSCCPREGEMRETSPGMPGTVLG